MRSHTKYSLELNKQVSTEEIPYLFQNGDSLQVPTQQFPSTNRNSGPTQINKNQQTENY